MIVGGLRARLIRDNFRDMVRDALDAKGWFDSGRQHLPVKMIVAPANWDEPVELTSVAVSALDVNSQDAEMGSNLTDDSWTFYVNVYAESETIGLELVHDVRDILRGKAPSIGRSRPVLDVLDLTATGHPHLFYCEIENVVVDRASDFPHPWHKNWFSARCDLSDTYGDENDAPYPGDDDGGPAIPLVVIEDGGGA